jgi:hypothetical protein
MKAHFNRNLIPHAGVLLVIGTGLILTRSWPPETALFPEVGCIVVLLVTLISLIGELFREGGTKERPDGWVSSQRPEGRSPGRAPLIFGWLASLLVGVWALGYEFAAVAFVFFYMKTTGKQSWKISILFTVFSFLFLFSVFRLLLGVIWPHGALWEMFGL